MGRWEYHPTQPEQGLAQSCQVFDCKQSTLHVHLEGEHLLFDKNGGNLEGNRCSSYFLYNFSVLCDCCLEV